MRSQLADYQYINDEVIYEVLNKHKDNINIELYRQAGSCNTGA